MDTNPHEYISTIILRHRWNCALKAQSMRLLLRQIGDALNSCKLVSIRGF